MTLEQSAGGPEGNHETWLEFERIFFDEQQCRALAAGSGNNTNLALPDCELNDGGRALVNAVRSDQGPFGLRFELELFSVQNFQGFSSAIGGNTRLKELYIDNYPCDCKLKTLTFGFSQNRALTKLCVKHIDDYEDWQCVLESLHYHPSLRYLNLATREYIFQTGMEMLTQRALLVKEMLETNVVLEEFHTFDYNSAARGRDYLAYTVDEIIFEKKILPRLEVNKFRPRVRAIKEEPNLRLRAGLLGRSLHKVNTHRNRTLSFMCVSRNLDFLLSHHLSSGQSNKRKLSSEG